MLKKNNPRNIVVMRTDRIGEVLLSTVAVDVIKRNYPKADVTFVTSEYSRPIIEDRNDVEQVLTVDTTGKKDWLGKAFWLAAILKKEKFDMAIVFNPHRVLHLASFLAGIPCRVGYDRKWGFLLNKKIKDERNKGEKHEIEYTMDLLRVLGIDIGNPNLRLPVNRASEEAAANLLEEKGVTPSQRIIAIHPGSSNPAKIWPCERYAELLRRIKAEWDCRVAVLGAKEESDRAGELIEKAGVDDLNLVGKLSLKELAALLKRSALFIGNDTGPMHMAAALGVPVIAIFGRNIPGVSPVRWGPWGTRHVVFHEDPGCDPCYDTDCPYGYKCLKAVTVDAVFGAVKKMLVMS